MDFPQTIITQKLPENIITPEKCVIGIDYVQTSLSLARMILGACFGLHVGPFAQDMAFETAFRGSFCSLTFLREGGRVGG